VLVVLDRYPRQATFGSFWFNPCQKQGLARSESS
jgi:hypothetical protein